MKVSVVIVNYNVRYFIETCILSVQKALDNFSEEGEIIVVDNVSTDSSCKMIRNRFPNVTLIENTENVGFSRANNQGVDIAKGEYVLILNPDTVVGEDLFNELSEFVAKHDDIGALGVQLVDGTGRFLPESKRGIPTPKASFYKMLGSGRGKYYAEYLTCHGVGEIDVLVGAFMLIKKERYQKVGGFDEDYFMYGEDIDLSYKLQKAGYKNYYLGTTKVIHYKGESTRKDVRYLKIFHGAMNIFYKKHFKQTLIDYLLIKVGIRLWFLAKYFNMSNTPILIRDSKRILFVGNRDIVSDLQLKKKITTIPPEEVLNIKYHIEKNDIEELWFEEKSMSYQEIIEQITTHSFRDVLYKILPNSSTFLIGSNSADGRGEIIDLV